MCVCVHSQEWGVSLQVTVWSSGWNLASGNMSMAVVLHVYMYIGCGSAVYGMGCMVLSQGVVQCMWCGSEHVCVVVLGTG